MELLAEHLAKNVADDGGALVFAGDKGGPRHRGNFNKRVRWVENLADQHKTQGAVRKIADRLEALIQSHRDTAGDAGQP